MSEASSLLIEAMGACRSHKAILPKDVINAPGSEAGLIERMICGQWHPGDAAKCESSPAGVPAAWEFPGLPGHALLDNFTLYGPTGMPIGFTALCDLVDSGAAADVSLFGTACALPGQLSKPPITTAPRRLVPVHGASRMQELCAVLHAALDEGGSSSGGAKHSAADGASPGSAADASCDSGSVTSSISSEASVEACRSQVGTKRSRAMTSTKRGRDRAEPRTSDFSCLSSAECVQLAAKVAPDLTALPAALGAKLSLLSLGEVVPEAGFHNSAALFPVGFAARREFWSFAKPDEHTVYTCSILRQPGVEGPVFQLLADDAPSSPIQADSAQHAWLEVHARGTQTWKAAGLSRKFPAVKSAPEYFGYESPAVVLALELQPAAALCTEYTFLAQRSAIPTRIARSKEYQALVQARQKYVEGQAAAADPGTPEHSAEPASSKPPAPSSPSVAHPLTPPGWQAVQGADLHRSWHALVALSARADQPAPTWTGPAGKYPAPAAADVALFSSQILDATTQHQPAAAADAGAVVASSRLRVAVRGVQAVLLELSVQAPGIWLVDLDGRVWCVARAGGVPAPSVGFAPAWSMEAAIAIASTALLHVAWQAGCPGQHGATPLPSMPYSAWIEAGIELLQECIPDSQSRAGCAAASAVPDLASAMRVSVPAMAASEKHSNRIWHRAGTTAVVASMYIAAEQDLPSWQGKPPAVSVQAMQQLAQSSAAVFLGLAAFKPAIRHGETAWRAQASKLSRSASAKSGALQSIVKRVAKPAPRAPAAPPPARASKSRAEILWRADPPAAPTAGMVVQSDASSERLAEWHRVAGAWSGPRRGDLLSDPAPSLADPGPSPLSVRPAAARRALAEDGHAQLLGGPHRSLAELSMDSLCCVAEPIMLRSRAAVRDMLAARRAAAGPACVPSVPVGATGPHAPAEHARPATQPQFHAWPDVSKESCVELSPALTLPLWQVLKLCAPLGVASPGTFASFHRALCATDDLLYTRRVMCGAVQLAARAAVLRRTMSPAAFEAASAEPAEVSQPVLARVQRVAQDITGDSWLNHLVGILRAKLPPRAAMEMLVMEGLASGAKASAAPPACPRTWEHVPMDVHDPHAQLTTRGSMVRWAVQPGKRPAISPAGSIPPSLPSLTAVLPSSAAGALLCGAACALDVGLGGACLLGNEVSYNVGLPPPDDAASAALSYGMCKRVHTTDGVPLGPGLSMVVTFLDCMLRDERVRQLVFPPHERYKPRGCYYYRQVDDPMCIAEVRRRIFAGYYFPTRSAQWKALVAIRGVTVDTARPKVGIGAPEQPQSQPLQPAQCSTPPSAGTHAAPVQGEPGDDTDATPYSTEEEGEDEGSDGDSAMHDGDSGDSDDDDGAGSEAGTSSLAGSQDHGDEHVSSRIPPTHIPAVHGSARGSGWQGAVDDLQRVFENTIDVVNWSSKLASQAQELGYALAQFVQYRLRPALTAKDEPAPPEALVDSDDDDDDDSDENDFGSDGSDDDDVASQGENDNEAEQAAPLQFAPCSSMLEFPPTAIAAAAAGRTTLQRRQPEHDPVLQLVDTLLDAKCTPWWQLPSQARAQLLDRLLSLLLSAPGVRSQIDLAANAQLGIEADLTQLLDLVWTARQARRVASAACVAALLSAVAGGMLPYDAVERAIRAAMAAHAEAPAVPSVPTAAAVWVSLPSPSLLLHKLHGSVAPVQQVVDAVKQFQHDNVAAAVALSDVLCGGPAGPAGWVEWSPASLHAAIEGLPAACGSAPGLGPVLRTLCNTATELCLRDGCARSLLGLALRKLCACMVKPWTLGFDASAGQYALVGAGEGADGVPLVAVQVVSLPAREEFSQLRSSVRLIAGAAAAKSAWDRLDVTQEHEAALRAVLVRVQWLIDAGMARWAGSEPEQRTAQVFQVGLRHADAVMPLSVQLLAPSMKTTEAVLAAHAEDDAWLQQALPAGSPMPARLMLSARGAQTAAELLAEQLPAVQLDAPAPADVLCGADLAALPIEPQSLPAVQRLLMLQQQPGGAVSGQWLEVSEQSAQCLWARVQRLLGTASGASDQWSATRAAAVQACTREPRGVQYDDSISVCNLPAAVEASVQDGHWLTATQRIQPSDLPAQRWDSAGHRLSDESPCSVDAASTDAQLAPASEQVLAQLPGVLAIWLHALQVPLSTSVLSSLRHSTLVTTAGELPAVVLVLSDPACRNDSTESPVTDAGVASLPAMLLHAEAMLYLHGQLHWQRGSERHAWRAAVASAGMHAGVGFSQQAQVQALASALVQISQRAASISRWPATEQQAWQMAVQASAACDQLAVLAMRWVRSCGLVPLCQPNAAHTGVAGLSSTAIRAALCTKARPGAQQPAHAAVGQKRARGD